MATKPKARKTTASVRERAATYETPSRSLAEVFWLAFQALPEDDRNAFLSRLLADSEVYEELADAVAIIEARQEPSRPYEEFREEMIREGLL